MSDLELLELAAKAAGINIDKSPYNGGGIGNTWFDCRGNAVLDWHNGETWNPLTDDGGAQRLLVSLRLSLIRYALHVMVVDPNRVAVSEDYMADPAVATRRAIVRAAAEIGKGMK